MTSFIFDILHKSCSWPQFNHAACQEVLGKSLFLVGEIGGNDFNYPLHIRQSITKLETYVPHVINAISLAINVRLFSFANSII